MQRFKFTAENLLSVRKHEEEGYLQRLADASEVAREHQERLTQTDSSILRTLHAPSVDRLAADLYLQRMARVRAEQEWLATESAGQVDRARTLATQASARRKAVEQLRERQHDDWAKEMLREEDRDLSEQATVRALRASREQQAA